MGGASMNQAIPQQNTFNLQQAYKQAWHLIDGSKWPIWLVYLSYMLAVGLTLMSVSLLYGNGFDTAANAAPDSSMERAIIYAEMLLKILLAPLGVGAFMVAIMRVRGQKPAPLAGFRYFPLWLNLSLTQLIIVLAQLFVRESTDLLRTVGEDNTFVLILYFSGFFLINFFTIFALPLVADKQLRPWQAIKTSFTLTTRHWLKVLSFLASVMLLWIVLSLPVAINLGWLIFIAIAAVWLLPFSLLLFALLYCYVSEGQ